MLYEVYNQVIDLPPPPPPVGVGSSAVSLGGGVYGFTFAVEVTDAQSGTYTAELTFEPVAGSSIQQIKAYGFVDVNDQTTADALDGAPGAGYDKALDSYVLNPFGQNVVQAEEVAGTYYFSANTGGAAYEDANLAYVAATGGLHYYGQITRGSEVYDVDAFAYVPGDANGDGLVNVQDLAIVATNWELDPAQWSEGNFNGDTVVNVQDLAVLATFWTGGSGQSVPAPATLLLVALGGLGLLRSRRRGVC